MGAKIGHIVTKETREKIRTANIEGRCGMKGKHHTEESKRKISESHKDKSKRNYFKKGNKINLGRKISLEIRQKMSETHKRVGISKEHRKKMQEKRIFTPEYREKLKKSRARQVLPTKDTLIEIKIQNFLKELNYDFYTHKYMNINHAYQCDIFIPIMNLVIECDGDYWHKYPVGRDIDKVRTSELILKGFKVLRLWENEIKVMDTLQFKKRLGN